MRGPCFRGGGGNLDGGIERKGGRRQAKFRAAGLVAQFQGNVLLPQRSRCQRVHRQAENHRSLVHAEGLFGKREGFQLSLGIHHLAARESRRRLGFEVRRDQILFRLLARVDVESGTNVHDHGNLKRAAACRGFHRSIYFRFHHAAPGRHFRARRGQQGGASKRDTKRKTCDEARHTVTSAPSCCEITRLITPWRSSPVFSSTKAFREAFHASLKLVESAEIQISRTGVFGEITNLASWGSSKSTSSLPDSPSTSKPWASPRASRRFFKSSNAASAFR